MKTNMRNIIAAILLLCLCGLLCGCSDQWEAPYASLQKDGYNVSIRFDVNGGLFAGTKDVSVVDVYSLSGGITDSDGTVRFHLLAPEDKNRKEGAFTASRNGYFLAGWYTERSLRVDSNGQPLDEYGVLCSVSGRPQGYTYGEKWDFANDTVRVDATADVNADTPVLTLYAAWVPYIPYEIYTVDPETAQVDYLTTVETLNLEIPEWNEKTGKLDTKNFPKRDGYTFNEAFLSADLTQPLTGALSGQEHYVDYATGTLNVEAVPVYTTWQEGTWFKIYTAQQLYSNARLDGCYLLMNDIDFTDCVWSNTLVRGKFSGKLYGNGYTISNINAIQSDNSQIYGGLFGSIESGAEIRDVVLENVRFTIDAGSRMQGASFGLLTGSLSSSARLENVSITGKLYISENCYPQSDYTIGLLCGIGAAEGISYTIECLPAEDNTGLLTVTVHDDDTVSIAFINP